MSASFVLGSQTSSTYPKGTPPVFAAPAASLAEHFEQPDLVLSFVLDVPFIERSLS